MFLSDSVPDIVSDSESVSFSYSVSDILPDSLSESDTHSAFEPDSGANIVSYSVQYWNSDSLSHSTSNSLSDSGSDSYWFGFWFRPGFLTFWFGLCFSLYCNFLPSDSFPDSDGNWISDSVVHLDPDFVSNSDLVRFLIQFGINISIGFPTEIQIRFLIGILVQFLIWVLILLRITIFNHSLIWFPIHFLIQIIAMFLIMGLIIIRNHFLMSDSVSESLLNLCLTLFRIQIPIRVFE